MVIARDMERRRIANEAAIALLILGLAMAVWPSSQLFAHSLKSAVLAALVSFLAFLVFYIAKWMGAGDVKLAAGLAACLGLERLLPVWVISLALAVLFSMAWQLWHWQRYQLAKDAWTQPVSRPVRHVPYGGLLCCAAFIVWAWESGH